MIHQLKACTSLLKPIHTKLFKSVYHCFTNPLVNIISSSLQTCTFHISHKCAVITLPLKKNDLVIGNS